MIVGAAVASGIGGIGIDGVGLLFRTQSKK